MAATVTPYRFSARGTDYIGFTVVQTSAAAATEFELEFSPTDEPIVVTMLQANARLASGSGTTVQPEGGASSGWTDDQEDQRFRFLEAGSFVETFSERVMLLQTGSLWVRSSVDSGSDNTINSTYLFQFGAK